MHYDQPTPPSSGLADMPEPALAVKADRVSLDTALVQVDRLLGPRAERLDWRAEANLRLVRACLWRLQDATSSKAGAAVAADARS
jgi:hypothetical protein